MSAQRISIAKPGGLDRLQLEQFEAPEPDDNEVRISVHAAGVNYADCVIRRGLYSSAKEYVGWPITPGFEVAGVISAVGRGSDFTVGDRVVAVTLFGGYASELVVPAHQVFPLPEGKTMQEGAAFPTVFITAHYALHELVHPRRDHHVLVHSAAGGVGTSLIQLAKAAHCEVTGVVGRPSKVEIVDKLGADHIIDKSREPLWERARACAPGGFDAVFDANGPSTLNESYAHLRRPGKLVVYGFGSMLPRSGRRTNWLALGLGWLRIPRYNAMELTGDCKSVMAFNLSYLFDEHDLLKDTMDDLLGRWSRDELVSPPVRTYPLKDAADAQRDLESGTTIGKLVLTCR